jgi:hypothetical protein
MNSGQPISAKTTTGRTGERLGACLGELAELRACRLREVLRTQGVELKEATRVVVQSPLGEQELTLVPDAARALGPRWLIVAPCCGKARLTLYWDPQAKRFGCRRCLDVRSARDRLRKNTLIAPLLRLLADELDGGRRGRATGGRRAERAESGNALGAEIEAQLRELMKVPGTEGTHGESAACQDGGRETKETGHDA